MPITSIGWATLCINKLSACVLSWDKMDELHLLGGKPIAGQNWAQLRSSSTAGILKFFTFVTWETEPSEWPLSPCRHCTSTLSAPLLLSVQHFTFRHKTFIIDLLWGVNTFQSILPNHLKLVELIGKPFFLSLSDSGCEKLKSDNYFSESKIAHISCHVPSPALFCSSHRVDYRGQQWAQEEVNMNSLLHPLALWELGDRQISPIILASMDCASWGQRLSKYPELNNPPSFLGSSVKLLGGL